MKKNYSLILLMGLMVTVLLNCTKTQGLREESVRVESTKSFEGVRLEVLKAETTRNEQTFFKGELGFPANPRESLSLGELVKGTPPENSIFLILEYKIYNPTGVNISFPDDFLLTDNLGNKYQGLKLDDSGNTWIGDADTIILSVKERGKILFTVPMHSINGLRLQFLNQNIPIAGQN